MEEELKDIPIFKNEDEERAFWANHDSTEYLNWDEAEEVVSSGFRKTCHSERSEESPRLWDASLRSA